MAGGDNNPKHPSSSSNTATTTNKRPPPSSSNSDRKSRWESDKSSKPNSKPPPNRTPSDNKPTPKRGPIPSPNRPNPSPSQHGGPGPGPGPHYPFPDPPSVAPPPPPPPPTYDFHMLDRRTIVLADGTARSYYALPPDYRDFPVPPGRFVPAGGPLSPGLLGPGGGGPRGGQEYWDSLGLDGRGGPEGGPMKRKFGQGEDRERERERERERDELARQRQHLLQYGNAGASVGTGTSSSPFRRDDEFGRHSKYMRVGGGLENSNNNNVGLNMRQQQVDPAVWKAFLHFMKLLNENFNQRKKYFDNVKVQCLACGRSTKDFPDVHALIMHTYDSDNADLRVDHLGLHRALCVLMGWNYMRPPDNSRTYQFLPADEAAANQDDLILWPPLVIIHNTGKGKDGDTEVLGNKAMDNKLRDLGFPGGKSKSLYSNEGRLGITLIKFSSDETGLKEAMRLAEHFEKERHGRRDWTRIQSIISDRDGESNPYLVKVDERTGERRRILYGYLGTATDVDKLDYETRKKASIESKHQKLHASK